MADDRHIDWRDDDYVVSGVRLHYRRGGRGTPVLLLHGVTDSGPCWGRTADALAGTHDVILLDQRGHGLSDAPAHGYQVADLTEDAAGVVMGLGVAPVGLLGHSLGAMVGLSLAATHPDLVTRLVLDDPPFLSRPGAMAAGGIDRDEQRYEWFAWLRDLRRLSRDELIAYCCTESPAWSVEECVAWADSKLRVRERVWAPGGMEFAIDWRAHLADLTCPTMLVGGDPELGSLIDEEVAAEAAKLMHDGRVVRIPHAGHSIQRDQFEAFIEEVGPFLENR